MARAWEVFLDGIPAVCFCPTRSAAKWRAVAAWRDAGYGRRGEWPGRITARRRPDLDEFSGFSTRAWTPEYVELEIARRREE